MPLKPLKERGDERFRHLHAKRNRRLVGTVEVASSALEKANGIGYAREGDVLLDGIRAVERLKPVQPLLLQPLKLFLSPISMFSFTFLISRWCVYYSETAACLSTKSTRPVGVRK